MTNRQRFLQLLAAGKVDIESYSASPGFLGFFALSGNPKGRREAAYHSIREILDNVGDYTMGISSYIIGDLRDQMNEHDVTRDDIDNIIVPLLDAGLLRAYPHYDDRENIRELSSPSSGMVTKLCLAVMDVDGVGGHLFLMNDQGLIVYPHEDVGFGFISTTKESTSRGKKILEEFLERPEWGGLSTALLS